MMDRTAGTSNPLYEDNEANRAYDENAYLPMGQFFVAKTAMEN
jgi:hypothetical protein